jgi:malonate-semialdehyde dehydrogenase (acetylating)/methylmalonate-semialdehyde dehydrogenase
LRIIDHFIGGGHAGSAGRESEVFDPNTGQVQAHVRLGTQAELDAAVAAAQAAQPGWAATNPQRRARVLFNFKALVEANMDSLAHTL